MSALVQYEEMRVSVERCARIDEAADLRDKAAALQAYARQRDDRDLDVWTSEIKLRASVRIGELVRELDTAQGARRELHPEPETKSKTEAIADAGLSRSEAYRLQGLAGPRDKQAQSAGKAAAENYFANARQAREPATIEGLTAAVKGAVEATVGPKPTRPKPPPEDRVERRDDGLGDIWIDWITAVACLAKHNPDMDALARHFPALNKKYITETRLAIPRLQTWLIALEAHDETERSAA